MKKHTTIVWLSLTLVLSACGSEKVEIMKSPCVSAADDGPCGAKRPANDWWMKSSKAV